MLVSSRPVIPEATASSSFPWNSPLEDLPLCSVTPREWAAQALDQLDFLLSDHAHCEQKAAGAALGILARFPEHTEMVRPMLALAHEELHHFRQVLDLIEKRGRALSRPAPDFYVRELRQRLFRTPGGLGPYGDLLVINAFVEARSCERFRRLAEALLGQADAELASLGQFYRTLAAAEARHWELFRDLAIDVLGNTRVEARIAVAAEVEAEISSARPLSPRMH
jgi:tRNA-(ms[2]io[6]A)-hydroxylase